MQRRTGAIFRELSGSNLEHRGEHRGGTQRDGPFVFKGHKRTVPLCSNHCSQNNSWEGFSD